MLQLLPGLQALLRQFCARHLQVLAFPQAPSSTARRTLSKQKVYPTENIFAGQERFRTKELYLYEYETAFTLHSLQALITFQWK